jgi:hypothetical protein
LKISSGPKSVRCTGAPPATGCRQQLEGNKAAYARQVAMSPQFVALYPMAQTAEQFVDALFASATVMPTPAERQSAITAFGSGRF